MLELMRKEHRNTLVLCPLPEWSAGLREDLAHSASLCGGILQYLVGSNCILHTLTPPRPVPSAWRVFQHLRSLAPVESLK
eukprot:4797642-Amphidinium_carterae.1